MSPTRPVLHVRRALLAVAALCAFPGAASAQVDGAPIPANRSPHLAFVIATRLEAGGDRVATVQFEDGSEQHVVSGQGATLAVGGALRPHRGSPFAVRATAGLKFMTTKATNADIYLLRVPLELVGTYDFAGDFHVGGGYVRHTALRFHGGGIADDVRFEDANGGTVELGWRWAALAYTKIDYTDEFGNTYDASNVGLVLTLTLGGR
jgi:hypothetical protein